jgi:hypothetical protein
MKTKDELRALLEEFWRLEREETKEAANYYFQSWIEPVIREAVRDSHPEVMFWVGEIVHLHFPKSP